MAIVTNKYRRPLGLPSGQVLEPGIPTPVSNWPVVGANQLVRKWLKSGILEADTVAPDPSQPVVPAVDADVAASVVPVADEQAELITKLAALGIRKDRRASVEKLRKLLAEAEG